MVTGVPIGAEFRVGPSASEPGIGAQYEPTVVYSPDAALYFVAWTHQSSPTDLDVQAQRVRGNGTLKGEIIEVAVSGLSPDFSPDVAYSTARRMFLVVWTNGFNPKFDVHGQRFRPNGNMVGSVIPVATALNGADGDDGLAAVAYNTVKGQFQAVWTDGRHGLDNTDIYGQRIRDNGNLIGTSFAITTDTNNQYDPDVSFDPVDAEYYVAWSDERRASVDVYGQLLSSYGRLRGGQRRIGLGTGDDLNPAVCINATGITSTRWLVVWTDDRNAPDLDLRTRYVSNSGVVYGSGDFDLLDPPDVSPSSQWSPAMPVHNVPGTMGWPVVWVDDRGSSDDIWGVVFP
jgi:hypothetical protein